MWIKNVHIIEDKAKNFIKRISLRKQYTVESGEWGYWDWMPHSFYRKIDNIVRGSIGKKWDEVYPYLLKSFDEKFHHKIKGSWFLPQRTVYNDDNQLVLRDLSNYRLWHNDICISPEGILLKYQDPNFKPSNRKRNKKKPKISNFRKKIYYWATSVDYAFTKDYNKGIFKVSWLDKFQVNFTPKEGEKDLFYTDFYNMIAWLETHNKTYLIEYDGNIYYNINYNKTMKYNDYKP